MFEKWVFHLWCLFCPISMNNTAQKKQSKVTVSLFSSLSKQCITKGNLDVPFLYSNTGWMFLRHDLVSVYMLVCIWIAGARLCVCVCLGKSLQPPPTCLPTFQHPTDFNWQIPGESLCLGYFLYCCDIATGLCCIMKLLWLNNSSIRPLGLNVISLCDFLNSPRESCEVFVFVFFLSLCWAWCGHIWLRRAVAWKEQAERVRGDTLMESQGRTAWVASGTTFDALLLLWSFF